MSVESKSTSAVLVVILIGVAFLSVLPFFWIVAGSFKPHLEIQSGHVAPWDSYTVTLPPAGPSEEPVTVTRHFTWNNYKTVFRNLSGLPTYYVNTVYLAMAGTFLSLFVGTLAAYGFAHFRFPANKILFGMLLLTIMIPGEVTLIGRYELMFQLRLYDKIVGLLIAYVSGNLILVIFIMRNVFVSVPQDLLDAAMIDGASSWKIFWEIMIPVGKNGLAACAILTFLGIWNEFFFALTFTSLDKVRTLPIGIVLLQSQWGLMDSGVQFATVLLSFLPIVIVFMVMQKYFVRGLSAGALKG